MALDLAVFLESALLSVCLLWNQDKWVLWGFSGTFQTRFVVHASTPVRECFCKAPCEEENLGMFCRRHQIYCLKTEVLKAWCSFQCYFLNVVVNATSILFPQAKSSFCDSFHNLFLNFISNMVITIFLMVTFIEGKSCICVCISMIWFFQVVLILAHS